MALLSPQLPSVVGITTVCLVATIPITLANELSRSSLAGITAISNPFVLQAVIFGSVFAAVGNLRTSFDFLSFSCRSYATRS